MTISWKTAMLPAAVALSFVLIIPAIANEPAPAERPQLALPSEMAFQLPMNNYCSQEDDLDVSFQLSNASDEAANVTLFFYKQDGTSFTEEGTSYRDIGSTIVPGKPTTIAANGTQLYHINFGNHKTCGERIYLGKIKVNSGQVSLLARGWVNSTDGVEPITVNDNKRFELIAPAKP
ncbi:hypothetical protein ACFQ88_04040 [Paenibacillus sp. NPDC056579]|uniref:hypothetical protein n=1 Tax=Paenibacillus sp. NPDC056579 TaxID=3345871 RepID=UPI0036C8EB65